MPNLPKRSLICVIRVIRVIHVIRAEAIRAAPAAEIPVRRADAVCVARWRGRSTICSITAAAAIPAGVIPVGAIPAAAITIGFLRSNSGLRITAAATAAIPAAATIPVTRSRADFSCSEL